MTTRIRLKMAAGAAAACLLATTAFAQHAGKGKPKDDDDAATAGSTAAVDSRGRLRAVTPDEAAELVAGMARYLNQSSDGLSITALPSGAFAIDLDDRFQSASLARLGSDGRVVMQCVETKAAAAGFLGAQAWPTRAHAQPLAGVDLSRLAVGQRRAAPATAALEEK